MRFVALHIPLILGVKVLHNYVFTLAPCDSKYCTTLA